MQKRALGIFSSEIQKIPWKCLWWSAYIRTLFSKFLAASYNASTLCILSQFIPNSYQVLTSLIEFDRKHIWNEVMPKVLHISMRYRTFICATCNNTNFIAAHTFTFCWQISARTKSTPHASRRSSLADIYRKPRTLVLSSSMMYSIISI